MASPISCAYGNSVSGCDKPASFEKPLCYDHWKLFNDLQIFECVRCHRFDEFAGTDNFGDLCHECFDRERRGFPPAPVHAHTPIEPQLRYLYILKLENGEFYVGQTNSLELRLQEHQDGQTKSTKGKSPRLVYFEEWVGRKDGLNEEEARLTQVASNNPRAIRRIVADWQRNIKLVDLG